MVSTLEINRYFSLTSCCNAIGRSNHDFSPYKGFLWRENEEFMFWSFHPLAYETNNEHLRKPLFQGHTKIVLSIIFGVRRNGMGYLTILGSLKILIVLSGDFLIGYFIRNNFEYILNNFECILNLIELL